MALEDELKQEIKESENRLRDLHKTKKKFTKTAVYNWVLNNFHTRLPGGSHRYQTYFEYLDTNTVDAFHQIWDENDEEAKQEGKPGGTARHFIKYTSELFHSKTFRQYYEDIDRALLDAGIGEGLLKELAESTNPGDDYDYNKAEDIIRREWKKIIPVMYKAYVSLRKMGYNLWDLTG